MGSGTKLFQHRAARVASLSERYPLIPSSEFVQLIAPSACLNQQQQQQPPPEAEGEAVVTSVRVEAPATRSLGVAVQTDELLAGQVTDDTRLQNGSRNDADDDGGGIPLIFCDEEQEDADGQLHDTPEVTFESNEEAEEFFGVVKIVEIQEFVL